jgi:hypothetical protein
MSDPNFATISVQIEGEQSQEEITRTLFKKWLDHYLGESISPEWRLTAYTIDQVTIPSPLSQYCASRLGDLFIARTQVTAKTFLPSGGKCGSITQWGTKSRWFIAVPGIVSESETHRTIIFDAFIKMSGDTYTLEIIFNHASCN